MKLIFDKAKDEANQSKHGVPLSEAERLEWDDALIWQDTRRDYGEARMIALCAIGVVNGFIAWFMLTVKMRDE